MREKGRFLFVLFFCLASFAAGGIFGTDSGGVAAAQEEPVPRLPPAQPTLDQAQEVHTYGFWFERTVIRWQEFKPKYDVLSRIDVYVQKVGSPGNLQIAVKDAKGNQLWTNSYLQAAVPALGWMEIDVVPSIQLVPNRSYFIHLSSDRDSPGADNRYFWIGNQRSDYIRGIASVEKDWPGYDFAFRTWSDRSVYGKVAYIYDSDAVGAAGFKSLLDANGYKTTLVSLATVAETNFAVYDLILAGSDTGWNYNWGTPAAVDRIQESGKPVLGLGFGGACLFQQMDLSINWGHGWNGSERSIYVVDPKHRIFDAPYNIFIPRTRVLELYTSTAHIGEYAPDLSGEVILLGREATNLDHYPLVQEGPHMLWGFSEAPDKMTPVGKTLLVNVVDYLAPDPLYLSLNIEDALEGVPVNKLSGDAEAPAEVTFVEVVTKLTSYSAGSKDNVTVDLAVAGDRFGAPVNVWVRNSNGAARTAVSFTNLGGGQYRVTTDLSPVFLWLWSPWYYHKQIVWRFAIPNGLTPQTVAVDAEINKPCVDPTGNGSIKILAPGGPHSLMIANRTLLYENYSHGEVNALLQRLFTEAQGPPASHTPQGVIYYADRYDSRVANWDNTAINYTSEATANVVANVVDDLLEDWQEDATEFTEIYIPFYGTIRLPMAYPRYLLIVGDDNAIPFYRYNDPYNDEQTWLVTNAANPAIRATDLDYFFTDNPYGDLYGGTDWQTGDLELWVGRLLGDSAADMLSLLEEGVDWSNGRTGGAVMASVDGWELGLEPDDGRAGEIADLYDVTALLRAKGFAVRNDNVPAAEVRTIDVMSPFEGGNNSWNLQFRNAANNADGMDLFFIGGHDSYDHAVIPGNDFSPDDTPGLYTRFDDDHPIAMIVGCHGGLPVPDLGVDGGVDHCMVYDLAHEGARAYIGATGFSYGSPNNLHRCTWGERLMQRFFKYLVTPAGSNTMTLGKALAESKRDYTFGYGNSDALDRKTVTEFNLYGVPWVFNFYPNALSLSTAMEALETERVYAASTGPIVAAEEDGIYTTVFEVNVPDFYVQTEIQEKVSYDLFSVKGGDTAVAPGVPILPFVKSYFLPLPEGATVEKVEIIKSETRGIGRYNVPIASVRPWSEGGMTYTTRTDIAYPYPRNDDRVQYQASRGGAEFSVFPIQHNPATDETFFTGYFAVQVTYQAPLALAITAFSTDKLRYMPKEPVASYAVVENIGDKPAVIQGSLLIKDANGEVLSRSMSDLLEIASGGNLRILLETDAPVKDGTYSAEFDLLNPKTVVAAAEAEIRVVSGEIVDLMAPEKVVYGEEGLFDVVFANYTRTNRKGEVFLSIQDQDGGYVKELPSQPIAVEAGANEKITFKWAPEKPVETQYSATAKVLMDDQWYGPQTESFLVQVPYCEGDFDRDSDVDGSDLAVFAADFGRTDCVDESDCEGDFNADGDVDGSDLAIFAADFGRTDCP